MNSPLNPTILESRHRQVLLLLATFFVSSNLGENLSITIVSMTDTSNLLGDFQVFNWTSSQRGVLLGTFFCGYSVSNPPAGIMTNRLPTRYLLSVSSLTSGLLTVLFPVITFQTGFVGSCISRALLGVFQGFTLPCASAHLAKWSAPEERAPFLAFIFNGFYLGAAAITILAGYLADSSRGWPSVFYISGTIAILWSLVTFWFLRDSPDDHERISIEERTSLVNSLVQTSKKTLPIPWTEILNSVPLWTAVVTGLCHIWGVRLLGTMLPTYMKAIFDSDIKQTGLYSAIPIFGMILSGLISPILAKFATRQFQMSLNLSRKIWSSISEYGAAVCLAIIGLAQPGATAVVVLLFIAQFCIALSHLGYWCSAVDLSPNFAGILMGILNGMSQIAALLAPTLIGFMLQGDGTPLEWSAVFIVSAGIMTLGGSAYNFFGSAEVQPWNAPQRTS